MNHAKGFIKAYDYNEAEVYQGFSSLNWGHALCVGNGDIGVVRGDTLCVGCIVRGGGGLRGGEGGWVHCLIMPFKNTFLILERNSIWNAIFQALIKKLISCIYYKNSNSHHR